MFGKESLVFILGMALIVLPFLGIPESWRFIGVSLCGVLLVFVGYALRRAVYLKGLERENGERAANSFVETTEKLFE
jgi:hypothetical protein